MAQAVYGIETEPGSYVVRYEAFLASAITLVSTNCAMTSLDIRPEADRAALQAVLTNRTEPYDGEQVWRHIRADGSVIQILPYVRSLEAALESVLTRSSRVGRGLSRVPEQCRMPLASVGRLDGDFEGIARGFPDLA